MKKCRDCEYFKNGCNFSEIDILEEQLKEYVACVQYKPKNKYTKDNKGQIGGFNMRSNRYNNVAYFDLDGVSKNGELADIVYDPTTPEYRIYDHDMSDKREYITGATMAELFLVETGVERLTNVVELRNNMFNESNLLDKDDADRLIAEEQKSVSKKVKEAIKDIKVDNVYYSPLGVVMQVPDDSVAFAYMKEEIRDQLGEMNHEDNIGDFIIGQPKELDIKIRRELFKNETCVGYVRVIYVSVPMKKRADRISVMATFAIICSRYYDDSNDGEM